jgi:hypothetical protein
MRASGKASAPMNSDIVNPIPATAPRTSTSRQRTPAGRTARRSRVAHQVARTIPSGLPMTSPAVIPANAASPPPRNEALPTETPALAKAKSGMITKATQR